MKKLISVLLAALLLLSSVSAAYADGEEWKDLIDGERYEEALPLVQADAKAGDPKAINVLARFYFFGWALEQDYDKAMELFQKASELDYAPSMQMIGYMYDAGVGVEQDYAKALDWYQKAAELGDFYTMYNLALMYQYGKGVEQDYDKANAWLLKAAELGNEGAFSALGYNCLMGLGFEQDGEKALEWYQKGAELGDPAAMFSIANMYDEGQGVEQDYGKAKEWLEKAAELDYPWAMAALGAYYRIGRGVDRDEEKAQEWLEKAAELGVMVDDEIIREMIGEDGDDVILSDDASDFVLLSEAVPDAILEIRYYSTYNFVGDRIDGYEEPLAFLTKEAAAALKEVSDELVAKGYRLKIYDAYRPQKAVTHFMNWALDTEDTRMKEYFYPELEKDVLFPQGYIAEHSGHSRGSTVDLTLFDMKAEKELDMGGTFDYFGELSHPDYTGITDEQYQNRMLLREAMLGHGFKPLAEEWWHFTLENEPYTDTYFTFPVNSDSLVIAEADAA